jgi:hypothetical protein
MGNSESRNKHSEENNNLQNKPNESQWVKAVNGNTEELRVSSPKKPVELNHAVFETTSENGNFTVSEDLRPVAVKNVKEGGDLVGGLFDKLSNLLQDTEVNGGLSNDFSFINNKLSQLTNLLEDTESFPQLGGNSYSNSNFDRIRGLLQETESNNLVGGGDNLVDTNPMINKLRDLLLQETESNILNLKGGALNNENLFSEKSEHNKESSEHKLEKRELTENNNKEDQNNLKTDQSGGEELDTELKNILVELQSNNKNVNKHVGGKSSRKGSKKSSKQSGSKRQSRRSSEASRASNNTYNIGDSDESDVEDYLSTSSMNTSDINIKHYRS